MHQLGKISSHPPMNRDLQNFEAKLKGLIGRPTDLRPFVCNGSPLTCDVIIVGINPATLLNADFWDFWFPGYGFGKAAWFEAYLQARRVQPLKPGKKRRNLLSNTRRVIEWIIEVAWPVRCLETNLYATPTPEAQELLRSQRISETFNFLLDTIKPRVIVAHGEDAKAYIQNHLWTKQIGVHVKCVPHFAFGWSKLCAQELGRWIRFMAGYSAHEARLIHAKTRQNRFHY
jgi:hypothetical protein